MSSVPLNITPTLEIWHKNVVGGEKGTTVSNNGTIYAVEGSAMARITPGSKGSLDDSKTW